MDYGKYARCSLRRHYRFGTPSVRYYNVGFRLARTE